MTIFSRLAIGTANWGHCYGHRNVVCPRKEQEEIIAYCMSAGIDTLHTKPEYEVDLSWVPTAFGVVSLSATDNALAPYSPDELAKWTFTSKWDWISIPYSPFDKRWEDSLLRLHEGADEVHVRSIFCQGKAFASDEPPFVRFRKYAREIGLPVGTLCILFCLLNPHVDKVIIGVDSAQQLRDNLRFFHRLDSFAVEDLDVIDPRRFGDKK